MKSQIIQIGNSQGIRIPKVLLQESRITGEVELEMHPDGILIRNARAPREGWDEAFKSISENEDTDDALSQTNSDFDGREWQW